MAATVCWPTFDPDLSETARRALERKGVEVILGHRAEDITSAGVTVAGSSSRPPPCCGPRE